MDSADFCLSFVDLAASLAHGPYRAQTETRLPDRVAWDSRHRMQRTNPDLTELGRIMGASPYALLRFIIIPSALPAFGSGLRVATAVAPIGAVVGEWVGSSSGLGFYMLHANARMQIDIMFAALTVLAIVSLTLYFIVDAVINTIIYWETQKGIHNETTT